MAYCPRCGTEIDRGRATCSHCDAAVRPELRRIAAGHTDFASLGRRMGAIVMDTLIMFFFWGFLVLLLGVRVLSGSTPGFGVFNAMVIAELFFIVGYTVLLEGYWNGQTVGKKVFDIRVVNADDGRPISVEEAVLRNVVRIVDFLPVFYVVGIAAVLLTQSNQRLGDLAGNTVVVNA